MSCREEVRPVHPHPVHLRLGGPGCKVCAQYRAAIDDDALVKAIEAAYAKIRKEVQK